MPEKYGLHELISQQEIRHSHINGKFKKQIHHYNTIEFNLFFFNCFFQTVTEYFKGNNWKVHPDFVFCEYNSLKDLDKELETSGESFYRDREDTFDTPEEQVLHFLSRAGRPGWKWMSVRFQKASINKRIF